MGHEAAFWLALAALPAALVAGARRRPDGRSHRRRREVLAALARAVGPGPRAGGPIHRHAGRRTPSVQWKTARARPRQLVADRLGRSHLPDHRATTTASACRCSRIRAPTARSCGRPFIPQNGVEYVHYKNGYASATPATDGELVYASFGRHGLVAFDFNGKIVWQHKFGIIDNYHGPAGSPVLYKDRDLPLSRITNPAPGQTRVRRRVRQEDRQDDLADAAARDGRLGHGRS